MDLECSRRVYCSHASIVMQSVSRGANKQYTVQMIHYKRMCPDGRPK